MHACTHTMHAPCLQDKGACMAVIFGSMLSHLVLELRCKLRMFRLKAMELLALFIMLQDVLGGRSRK